jgi:surfactin synthase thioesterase subunit
MSGRTSTNQKEANVYAAVRRYEGVTDTAEDRRRVAEEFLPLLKDIPGFVAYYEIDAGNGVMATISVFEDQAGEEASTERAAEWVRENEASIAPNPPEVTAGEVVASG